MPELLLPKRNLWHLLIVSYRIAREEGEIQRYRIEMALAGHHNRQGPVAQRKQKCATMVGTWFKEYAMLLVKKS